MAGRGVDDQVSEMDKLSDAVYALEGLGEDSVWNIARDPIHEWVDNAELRIKCNSFSRSKPGPQTQYGK